MSESRRGPGEGDDDVVVVLPHVTRTLRLRVTRFPTGAAGGTGARVARIDRSVYAVEKRPRRGTGTCYSSAQSVVAAGRAETGVPSEG